MNSIWSLYSCFTSCRSALSSSSRSSFSPSISVQASSCCCACLCSSWADAALARAERAASSEPAAAITSSAKLQTTIVITNDNNNKDKINNYSAVLAKRASGACDAGQLPPDRLQTLPKQSVKKRIIYVVRRHDGSLCTQKQPKQSVMLMVPHSNSGPAGDCHVAGHV